MVETIVAAEIRTKTGKSEAKRLRRKGYLPGVVYGEGRPGTSVYASTKDILKILASSRSINTLFKLKQIGGDKERLVMFRDFQYDPVDGSLIHVDFVRINMKKSVDVKVPVEAIGTAPGVKDEGGILNFILRELHLRCLPERIPDAIKIDISGLHLKQSVKIKDIDFGEGIEVVHPTDTPILIIAEPKKEPTPEELAAAAAPEGAPAEPEIIAKGKAAVEGKEEETAGAAPAPTPEKEAPKKESSKKEPSKKEPSKKEPSKKEPPKKEPSSKEAHKKA